MFCPVGRKHDQQFIVFNLFAVSRGDLIQTRHLTQAWNSAQSERFRMAYLARNHRRLSVDQGNAALVLAIADHRHTVQ